MAGTLLPVGYGERQRKALPTILFTHVLGSTLAGAVLGAVFGGIGHAISLDRSTALLAVGIFCLIYGFHEAGLIRLPTPQFERQVPHGWRLRFRPGVAAFLYGAGLGVGLGTMIPVTTFYAVVLAAVATGDPVGGACALGAYGFFRTLPLVWLAVRASTDASERAERVGEELWLMRPLVSLLNGLGLALGGAFLVLSTLP